VLRSARRVRAALVIALSTLIVLAFAGALPTRPALGSSSAQSSPDTVLVTLAATAEDLDAASPGVPFGGIVIQITLENRSGRDIANLEVRSQVPAGTLVAAAGIGALGTHPGAVDGATIRWSGVAIKNGDRLPPLLYRLAPAQGTDGAAVFRRSTIQPEITWTQPGSGRAPSPTLPLLGIWGEGGVRRTVLPTLLTIFTRERPDTLSVALDVAVRAGSRDEDDTTWGGSHWLEHAHFLGTEKRPTNQGVTAPIDNVGGQWNAGTSREWTDYYKFVPAEHFDLALEITADQLLNSTFPADAFDRERRVVFEELKRNADDPSRRASDAFYRAVWQVSPLRRDAGGFVDTVASIPIETILAYRTQRYVTGNIRQPPSRRDGPQN